ncbi:hypothetical protein AMS68_003720 [Peltaster fructicola]|uniref:RAD52 homolog n=1 Tax=Peltaster fructicola TaxID=286661 RepID=A0A6H0XU03_9PEZI|nr:hypothetical protein AMS68_003720 [Peltaster fructicola]
MPMPGDQHKETPASINPFLPPVTRISEWTAQEIATLQSRLDKQLGPEFISTRPGAGGGKVHYLAAEKVINLANDVFGFNGWSSSIQNVQIDFCDEHVGTGKISLGLSTIVRVTLRDGTYHEDIGYGHIENCKGKAAAFEKAKKEAATDALKRALRNFGNMLGNCLYDKDYLQKVTKIKIAPSKWDEVNLHRHTDFAPVKKAEQRQDSQARQESQGTKRTTSTNSAIFEDDFETNMFDDNDFNDTTLASPQRSMHKQPPLHRAVTMPTPATTEPTEKDTWMPPPPREPPPDVPNGFITGRAVDLLDKPPEARPPTASMAFDPHFESPSIRRTQGINPGKSAPIKISTLNRQGPASGGLNGPAVNVHTNFVNPSADPNRRVGMPQPNRGAYKPPTTVKRPALADVSNIQAAEDGPDLKKPKVEAEAAPAIVQ